MVNKHILIFLIALILIPSISATVCKQEIKCDIRHSVRLNSAPTNTANCNITVRNPEGEIIVPFQPMTFNTTVKDFNYTINSTLIFEFGSYEYDITCLDSGFNATETFSFDVNRVGRTLSVAESIMFIFVLLLGLFFFSITLYGAIKIPFKNMRDDEGTLIHVNLLKHAKVGCVVLSYLFLTWVLWTSYNITFAFLELDAIGKFLLLFAEFMIDTVPFTLVLSLTIMLIMFFRDLDMIKKVKEGKIFTVNE